MIDRKFLIAGNWKMNGTFDSMKEIFKIDKYSKELNSDLAICLPYTIINKVHENISHEKLIIGAQNCHHEEKGAFTGDISANMLKDAGAKVIIVGHSERRQTYNENNNLIMKKARSVINSGLKVIICIGETEEEKNIGKTNEIVCSQLRYSIPEISNSENTVIAYEPIWAIGTGRIPSLDEIQSVHSQLRLLISEIKGADIANKIRILYGGSVKPNNAKDIFSLADVDGALVGGASLKSEDFLGIASLC